jgi:hypothetical protein
MKLCGRAGALAGPDSAREDLRVGEGAHAPDLLGETFKAIRRLHPTAPATLSRRRELLP